MLYLISIGLADEKDMSLRALDIAKNCDALFFEVYTDILNTDAAKLSKLVGKDVKVIGRDGLEDKLEKIINDAAGKDVGILVGGDALSATTHITILLEARGKKVPVKIIHGSSVMTAVAESGLQLYKLGRTTTLALPDKGYNPTSCYDAIAANKISGLHTLVLLDTRDRKMGVKEAVKLLLEMEKEKKGHVINEEAKVVAISRLGWPDQKIKYGKVNDILKQEWGIPAALIIPGELHFMEKEFLSLL